MRRILIIIALLSVGALLGASAVVLVAYHSLQQVPEFYAEALQADPSQQVLAADELEKRLLDLHNQANRPGHWEAEISDDEVNAWLAAVLTEKFPGILPSEIENPRVAVQDQKLLVACQHRSSQVTTVFSMELRVALTEQPNEIAIEVYNARAGLIPIPLKSYLNQIATFSRQAELPLKWQHGDGLPVALVTIPASHDQYLYREIRVENLVLHDGRIYLSGVTTSEPRVAGLHSEPRLAFPSL